MKFARPAGKNGRYRYKTESSRSGIIRLSVVYWLFNLPAHTSRSNIYTHITWRLMLIKRFVIRKGRGGVGGREPGWWFPISLLPRFASAICTATLPIAETGELYPDSAGAAENRILTTVRRWPDW